MPAPAAGAAPALAGIRIDRRRPAPLHRQIYERIRDAILGGRLGPGSRLPSSRSLASDLGTARSTVELAYQLLAGEGYVVARGAAGTIVDPALAHRPPAAGRPQPAPPGAPEAGVAWPASAVAPQPFRAGVPAFDLFPRKLWSRLAARCAREAAVTALMQPHPAGLAKLRQAVATYLGIARGIACAPDQVFVTAGYQGALGLATRVLVRPGEPVWMEDPGYLLARHGLALAGVRLVPVPVDAEGLRVEAGRRAAPRARLAVVTPSHHSPLGMALSLPRRLDLLAWAAEAGAWVLEDDYDGEFHFRGRPLPALKSLDEAGRVLYAGTFSKTLLPSLRLGYLVVPRSQVARFAAAAAGLAPAAGMLEQAIVATFMAEGHFARHLRRMRAAYGERRAALERAIAEAFGERLRLDPRGAGMTLVAWLPPSADDTAEARRAQAHGLAATPLSPWCIKARRRPGLILGFATIPAETAAREARRLERAIYGD